MMLLSLDLEMNQPSRKIIQIGYAVGDTASREIVYRASHLVNPQEPISDYITQLTGISDDDVSTAGNLSMAYFCLKMIAKKYNCFINPVTWGGGDCRTLREQLPDSEEWVFGRREIDAKTIFVTRQIANNTGFKGGLKRSMKRLGMNFDGRPHNAEDDAYNTLKFYFMLMDLIN